MKRKSVIIFAAITFSSLGVCAENNNTITAAQVKATPYTTVFFAPRTQYRTASESFLQRLMLTGVVQDPDSILKSMYWSFETDADLGKHMDQWKSSYQEAEFNKPFARCQPVLAGTRNRFSLGIGRVTHRSLHWHWLPF